MNEIEDLTSFLSSTIDEFQERYLLSDNDNFSIEEICIKAQSILSRKLKKNDVKLECKIDKTVYYLMFLYDVTSFVCVLYQCDF